MNRQQQVEKMKIIRGRFLYYLDGVWAGVGIVACFYFPLLAIYNVLHALKVL